MSTENLVATNKPWRMLRRLGRAAFRTLTVIFLLAALFYAEEDWRGWRAWRSFQRDQTALGFTIDSNFKHLAPPPVPDDQNFAATPFWKHLFSPEYLNQTADFQALKDNPTNVACQTVLQVLRVGDLANSIHDLSWADGESLDVAKWLVDVHRQAFPQQKSRSMSAKTALRYHLRLTPSAQPLATAPLDPSATNLALLATNLLDLTDELKPVFEEFRTAAKRPFFRFDINYANEDPSAILLPHLPMLSHAAQILRIRSIAELALNQIDEAADDLILSSRLARATESEPFLLLYSVERHMVEMQLRTIWERIEQHKSSEQHLRQFESLLARIELPPLLEHCLEGEQIIGNCLFDDLRRHPHPPKTVPPPLNTMIFERPGYLGIGLWSVLPAGWMWFEELNFNRQMLALRNFAPDRNWDAVSPAQVNQEDARVKLFFDPDFQALKHHRFVAKWFLGGIQHTTIERTAFAQTGVNLARVACALERFRLAKGGYPASLNALTPDWIKSIPKDIINGGPLHYVRPNADSYRLYSVGWNERDDGGEIAFLKPPEIGVPNLPKKLDLENGDWVWAIP